MYRMAKCKATNGFYASGSLQKIGCKNRCAKNSSTVEFIIKEHINTEK